VHELFLLKQKAGKLSNVIGQCCFVCTIATGSPVYIGRVNFHDYPEQEPGRQKPCVTRTEINKATLSSARPELKLTNRGKFYTPNRYINPHISDVKIVSNNKEGKIKQSIILFSMI